jgi:WD40 repeat protein
MRPVFTGAAHTDRITGVAFTPDGRGVWSCGRDGKLILWDVATGQRRAGPHEFGEPLEAIALTPDGRQILLAADELIVVDPKDGHATARLGEHRAHLTNVVVSPDGRQAATFGRDGGVRLWDLATHKSTLLARHGSGARGLAFLPDGRHLLSGGSRRALSVKNPDTGRDNDYFTGDDGSIRLWPLPPSTLDKSAPAAPPPEAQSSDLGRLMFDEIVMSRQAAETARERLERTQAIAAANRKLFRFEGRATLAKCIAFSPDGKRFVTATSFPRGDRGISLWDFSGGKVLDKIDDVSKYCDAVTDPSDAVASNEHGSVFALAWSPDGKRCAAGLGGGAILFDWKNGVERLGGQLDSTYAVAFSPDGRQLATAGRDATLRVWDVETRRQVFEARGHYGAILGVTYAPDGRTIWTCGRDGMNLTFDAATGKQVWMGYNGNVRIEGQAFTPGGTRVVMAADELIVYDAATHKTLHRLGRDQGPYVGVAVTADGSRAVAAGADGRYWLLNLNDVTLTLICQLAAGSRGFALTPDGRYLLNAGDTAAPSKRSFVPDKSIHVWELPAAEKPH